MHSERRLASARRLPSALADRLSSEPASMAAIALLVAASMVLAACSAGASSPSASSSPGASPSGAPASSAPGSGAPGSVAPGGPIETPDQAAAVVLALDPHFASIQRKDPELIGQAAWYTVDPGPGDAWTVQVRVGWGDCPSGCIEEHVWTYEVARAGSATLLSETGPGVPAEAWPAG